MWHTHTGTSENIQGSLIVQKLAKKDGCDETFKLKSTWQKDNFTEICNGHFFRLEESD